jgi:hypothetical protein
MRALEVGQCSENGQSTPSKRQSLLVTFNPNIRARRAPPSVVFEAASIVESCLQISSWCAGNRAAITSKYELTATQMSGYQTSSDLPGIAWTSSAFSPSGESRRSGCARETLANCAHSVPVGYSCSEPICRIRAHFFLDFPIGIIPINRIPSESSNPRPSRMKIPTQNHLDVKLL